MAPDDIERLLAYDGRRYWLENGWSIQCRAWRTTKGCLRYSLTLHDEGRQRIYGVDNDHNYDHEHRFNNATETIEYKYRDADMLLADFFETVARHCSAIGVEPDIVAEDNI